MVKMLKVLIISHNPITTYDAMGKTFASLFSAFERKELCQLYIYPTIPDVDFCHSYYRITDKDILNSYFKFSVKGRMIAKSEINTRVHSMFENPEDESLYRNKKNKKASRMLLRDVMWKFAHWYNKDLKNWIREQAPTHIFVAPGTAKFLYDMALKISKKFDIPIITYICDEYYFVKKPKGFLNKIQVNSLQKKIAKLMRKTSHIVTICDNLSELYSKEFSVPTTVIMTGTSYKIAHTPIISSEPTSITYMGNIRCNRYNSLVEIGQALQKINLECNANYVLKIYTAEKDESILKKFDGIETIKLCGYVAGDEFERIFHSSEVLLHTEAFDDNSIDLVKNSVSTKIADSLASGIPLLAYGPAEVASMQHLIKNDCAMTAISREELYNVLKQLFSDAALREKVTSKAIKIANIYHNSELASENLRKVMESIDENTSS